MRLIVGIAVTLVVMTSVFFHGASFSQSMPQKTASSGGVISGRVLDAEGKPIINATVTAEMANAIGGIPNALTNKDGEFIIRGLRPGQYTLHARKEEDGYPRTEFNLYDAGTSTDPQVEVLEDQTMQNVIVQLGLKSGILTLRVVDANSNQPLHHADITIRRVDLPDRYLSSGLSVEEGEFKILVPALPFTV